MPQQVQQQPTQPQLTRHATRPQHIQPLLSILDAALYERSVSSDDDGAHCTPEANERQYALGA
jgi:hypothetical protein